MTVIKCLDLIAAEQLPRPSRQAQTPFPKPGLWPSALPQALGLQTSGPVPRETKPPAGTEEAEAKLVARGKGPRDSGPSDPPEKAPNPQGKRSSDGAALTGTGAPSQPRRAGAVSSFLFAHLVAGRAGEGAAGTAATRGGDSGWFPPPR